MNATIKNQIASAISDSFRLNTPLATIRGHLSEASSTLDMEKDGELFAAACEAEQALRQVESAADRLQTKVCSIMVTIKTQATAIG